MNIVAQAKNQAKELYGNIPCDFKITTNNGYHYESTGPTKTLTIDHGECISFIEKDRRRIKVDAVKKLGIPEGPLLGQLQ